MTRHAERRSASFRRMLFSVSLFVLPLALGLFVITNYLMPLSSCANDVVAEIPSPSGSHRAFVFRLNCGATTGYSTHVSVVRSDEPLPDRPGNLLVLGGEHPIEVTWVRPEHLQVRYPQGPEVFFTSGEAVGVTATLEAHALGR